MTRSCVFSRMAALAQPAVRLVILFIIAGVAGMAGCGERIDQGDPGNGRQAGGSERSQQGVPMESKTLELTVTGMHCDGCVRAIHNALTEAEGVLSDSISLADNRAVVTYDPSRVKEADIVQMIAELGYEAKPAGAAGEP